MIVKDGVGGKERWAEQTLRPFTKKAPARKPTFETTSGIPFEDLYTPEDLADLDKLAARWGVSRPEAVRIMVRHVLHGAPLPASDDDTDDSHAFAA